VSSLEIQKLAGFNRIYQAECFPDEVKNMFGKSLGEINRYMTINRLLHELNAFLQNWRIDYEH